MSCNPLRAAAAGTNCRAHFTPAVFLVLSLRRHCLEQLGLPSHSLSSPGAAAVCPHGGIKSELGGYVRREAGGRAGGQSSLGCAQPRWPRTPERLPPSSPQSLHDKVCASSVFLQNTLPFIQHYISPGVLFWQEGSSFFHISLVSSFRRLHSFVVINHRTLKLIGPLAALERLFEIKAAKDRNPPFPRPDIQIAFALPSGGVAFGYKLRSISGEPTARDHNGSTPRTEL